VQNVTVTVQCDDQSADVDASEDGKFLNLAEFKRGFFLAFDAVSEARVKEAAAAKEEAAKLEKSGFSVLRVTTEDGPKKLYKVQVGPFSNAADAAIARSKLESMGYKPIQK
jgi:hypothetical protein